MAEQQGTPDTPPSDQARLNAATATVRADTRAMGTRTLPPSLLLLVGLAAVAIVLLFMRAAAEIIDPLLLALVITMAVSPLTYFLIRKGFPGWLAWLITVVVTVAAITLIVVVGVAGLARLVAELPKYQAELTARWQQATDAIKKTGLNATGATQGGSAPLAPHAVLSFATRILRAIEATASLGMLTLLLIFFMLAEAVTITRRFATTPPQVGHALARLEDFTRDMRQFVQATTITGLLSGIAVGLFLWLLGVPYAFLWGLFAFFMAFIPTLGPLIATVPPTFLALLEKGWVEALVAFLVILVIYVVVGNAVGRPLVARRTNLSALAVVISVVVWAWVLGPLGGLLAVPMTLLVRRLFIETYDQSGWMTALLGRAPAAKRSPD